MAHAPAKRRRPMAVPELAEKENRAPVRDKRKVDIRGMLKKGYENERRKRVENRDILSPIPAGVTKSSKASKAAEMNARFSRELRRDGTSKRPTQPLDLFATLTKSINTPNRPVAKSDFFKQFHLGYSEPISDYYKAVEANFQHRMAKWRKETDLCRDGKDAKAKPIRKAPVPSRQEIDALRIELEGLLKPVDDEILHIQDTQSGGSKSVKLSDTKKALDRRIERNSAQIAELERQQKRVDDEIKQLKIDILEGDDNLKNAKQKYEDELATYQKEIEKVEATAKKEYNDMRMKVRENKKAFNRKIQDLWEELDNDD